jgi:hypothetical protein
MEVSGQLHDPTALLPGKDTPVPIGQEAGSVRTLWSTEKSLILPGIERRPSNTFPIVIPTELSQLPIHEKVKSTQKICRSKPSYLFLKLYCRSSDGTHKVDHLNIDHRGERARQLFLLLTHKRGHSVHGPPPVIT